MESVLDLSHTLAPDMPVYPGTERPTLRPTHTVEQNGFAETLLSMYSHTGTHIDAPAHMLAQAPTLDRLGVTQFVGEGCVIDVAEGTREIDIDTVTGFADRIGEASFVLFHTGWDRYWGEERYFSNFPVLSREAARWLAGQGLKGVGFDAISADAVGATSFVNHLHFFRAGMVIVENLRGLAPLAGQRFLFSCLPLRYGNADGSPVRAVALLR